MYVTDFANYDFKLESKNSNKRICVFVRLSKDCTHIALKPTTSDRAYATPPLSSYIAFAAYILPNSTLKLSCNFFWERKIVRS